MQTSSLNPSLCLVWRKGSPSSTGFDNALLCELPVLDTAQDGAGEEGHCYKRVKELKRMENPQLIVASAEVLQLAGFDVERADHREERGEERGQKEFVPVSELVPFLVGNEVLQGSELAVQCYNGLKSGDSDAIYAGEVVNDAQERWELQLHFAGSSASSGGNDSGRSGLARTFITIAWQDTVILHRANSSFAPLANCAV